MGNRSTRLYFFVACLFSVSLQAQELTQIVTVTYSDQTLGHVLDDLSKNYDLKFSYSADYIPLESKIWVRPGDKKLSEALDDICDQASVAYRPIGGQLVLKYKEKEAKRTSSAKVKPLRPKPLPKSVPQTTPIYSEAPTPVPPIQEKTDPFSPLAKQSIKTIPGGNKVVELDAEVVEVTPYVTSSQLTVGDNRLAQISLLPFLGTNADKSEYITNNVSVNIFWGTNGGVDGVEVGGFVNTIVEDVQGVQVAGFGNTVKGNVIGTQVGGLFNTSGGEVQGLQAAGLFNVSNQSKAVQASGLFNVSAKQTMGIQASGLFNVAGRGNQVSQASALFNVAGGHATTQISGLFNVGGDIGWGQISPLFNVGKKVDGFQIGLINIADSVGGLPIGILNIIRHGYNKVELSSSESLLANFGLKLGVKGFYNIISLGARWDQLEVVNGNETINGNFMTWGVGYGLGTAITFSPRFLVNIEAITMHINEAEPWTNELNQLNQLKLLFDLRLGRGSSSVFFGPVGNLMLSKVYNEDTQEYGSLVAPYTLRESTSANGVNSQMWLGFTGGIRF
ncbi:MAG: hypothetical protein F6K19_31140 [Cyanothece sp. SIO1E1]|nr:hypothetical protein [Cyanothece sp. SIO1E1]